VTANNNNNDNNDDDDNNNNNNNNNLFFYITCTRLPDLILLVPYVGISLKITYINMAHNA
jgi:hypothetical protein